MQGIIILDSCVQGRVQGNRHHHTRTSSYIHIRTYNMIIIYNYVCTYLFIMITMVQPDVQYYIRTSKLWLTLFVK